MSIKTQLKHLVDRSRQAVKAAVQGGTMPTELPVPIRQAVVGDATATSIYWNNHTVRADQFTNPQDSVKYIDWVDEEYPLYHEFMKLYEGYDDQVVMDYGCGPANDLVGFLTYSKAKKVIGVDVSEKALRLASRRLGLHKFDPNRIELILISDDVVGIPLEDNSVDYIHSQGVIMITSHPDEIVKEFHRILKPGHLSRIMVYNYDSIWVHLYVAYQRMIVENRFPGLDLAAAFTRSTDGEGCPVSRYYRYPDFIALCERAGFQTEYVGGYMSRFEVNLVKEMRDKALEDSRFPDVHHDFLKSLTFDSRGYPIYEGKYAGIGGVYQLVKPQT
jgi:SAM-dependent methyltransferase